MSCLFIQTNMSGYYDNDGNPWDGKTPFKKGKYVYENGDVYVGCFGEPALVKAPLGHGPQMTNVDFEGEGKLTMQKGLWEYVGQFHKDKFHGSGCLSHRDGYTTTGEWKNGKRMQ